MPDLSPAGVDALLSRVHHARLGLVDEAGIYVVPVGFVYVEGCFWFHSGPGRKARALARDPRCCLEVDEYDQQTAAWSSVIAWGEARPGSSPAAWAAMKARFGHVLDRVLRRPEGASSGEGAASSGQLYRLEVERLTARCGP